SKKCLLSTQSGHRAEFFLKNRPVWPGYKVAQPRIEKTAIEDDRCVIASPPRAGLGVDRNVGFQGRRTSKTTPFCDDQAVALRRRRLPYPVGSLCHSLKHIGLPQRTCRRRTPAGGIGTEC